MKSLTINKNSMTYPPLNCRRLLLCLFLSLLSLSFAKDGAVQCGNLIYAGTKTSKCFSDEFLSTVQQKTSITTERRFKPVKLASDELFKFPFVIISGEEEFMLTSKERENLKKYLENGGFLLASAGCSNVKWKDSFEKEIKRVFSDKKLEDIKLEHQIFKTIFKVGKLDQYKSSGQASLKGITHNDKLVVVYSPNGLNDSSNTEGCCCCGGSEIKNSLEINANILAYALLH